MVPKSLKNIPELFELNPSEKLQLVEDLWDDIASNPMDIPIPKWQKDELDKRKKDQGKNQESKMAWQDVKKRIRARNGR